MIVPFVFLLSLAAVSGRRNIGESVKGIITLFFGWLLISLF